MGRQPWVGLRADDHRARRLARASAPAEVLTSLIVFTLLYGVLAVVEVRLMLTYIRRGADPLAGDRPTRPTDGDADRPLAFAY